jgi:DNA-binding response OmpR family regulator
MKAVPIHNPEMDHECIIMVVDEDEAMRAVLVEALQEQGCRVMEYYDGKGVLNALQEVRPQVIVTDLKIPNGGYAYLRLLQASASASSIVVMTAHGDSQSKAKALECGAKGYLEKPIHLNDLKEWISKVCPMKLCGNIL